MEDTSAEFAKKILDEFKDPKPKKGYSSLSPRIKFNPFPAAGLPRFMTLNPLDSDVNHKILQFLRSTYLSGEAEDYAGLTIIGDFGMGKTHIIKYIIELINSLNKQSIENKQGLGFSAIACFIDKPEDAPQRVVHKIVEQIGMDNIRKYLGRIIVTRLLKKKDTIIKKGQTNSLFLRGKDGWENLFKEPVVSNYLQFFKNYAELGGDMGFLQREAREIIKSDIVQDSTIVDRYLELIFSDDKKSSNSWDILAGYISNRNIQHKEVMFLNSVVKILRHEGYRQLYVFVDEFEDVSKLKGAKLTNYLITLNTLINQERNWALVVSLTNEAMTVIKEESAPLYDRLTSFKITLQHLDFARAKKLISNYLNLARDLEGKSNEIKPFEEKVIKEMLSLSKGNYRSFILLAHKLVEIARMEKSGNINEQILAKVKEIYHE